jgi:hypothetical protein
VLVFLTELVLTTTIIFTATISHRQVMPW